MKSIPNLEKIGFAGGKWIAYHPQEGAVTLVAARNRRGRAVSWWGYGSAMRNDRKFYGYYKTLAAAAAAISAMR